MDERAPPDGICRHGRVIELLSHDGLIACIESTEPLPDANDDDPAWLEDATWDRAEFLLAAAEAIGERKLLRAVAPLFQRAALGDAYEMMQNLRHGPEWAAAPNWQALTGIMLPLTRHYRAGCRRWAVRELGILRDPQALDDLMSALADDQPMPLLVCRKIVHGDVAVVRSLVSACIRGWACPIMSGWGRWSGG